MPDGEYFVELHELIREFKLEILYGPEGYLERKIISDDVNRPALQLTGFFEYFNNTRIQILGQVEHTYLRQFSSGEREEKLKRLFQTGIPMMVITRGQEPFPECFAAAKECDVVLARTQETTSSFMAALTASLNVHLGPRTNVHGVLVEVYGEGVLLLGNSGIGKSETAIELVKRGHRLVADDVVDIKRVSAKTLVGSAPELIRYFVELRGIGIIDVRRIFGMGAVKPTEKVDLVVHLEPWEEGKVYERLGADERRTSILDIEIPSLVIPVKPGRNLAVIIEVAAMNNRNKKMGHNAAKELSDKLYANMLNGQQP